MINRVVLTGRLTKEVDLSYTQQGVAKAQFTLAVNRAFSNQQGEKEADFITIQAWRKQAENAANFLRKGSLVGIDGRIQTGSYEKEGKRIYFTNVVAESIQFLEPRGINGDSQNTSNQQNGSGNYGGGQPSYNNPPQQQYGGAPGYQQNQPPQQNVSRMDEDPFANKKGPVEVSEDDLPF